MAGSGGQKSAWGQPISGVNWRFERVLIGFWYKHAPKQKTAQWIEWYFDKGLWQKA